LTPVVVVATTLPPEFKRRTVTPEMPPSPPSWTPFPLVSKNTVSPMVPVVPAGAFKPKSALRKSEPAVMVKLLEAGPLVGVAL
jgi:hypothetical protein